MAVIRSKKKSGGGKCCFFGCFTIVALLFLLIGGSIFGFMWGLDQLKVYADDKPLDLPQVTMDAEEIQDVITRWDEFRASANSGAPATVELTDTDINALFQHHAGLAEYPQLRNTYVRIEEGTGKIIGSYALFDESNAGEDTPYLNFVLTVVPAETGNNFFKFEVEKLTFPAENITPEQKTLAQDFITEWVTKVGESAAQSQPGRMDLTGNRVIIVTGSESAVAPEATTDDLDTAPDETALEPAEETPAESTETF